MDCPYAWPARLWLVGFIQFWLLYFERCSVCMRRSMLKHCIVRRTLKETKGVCLSLVRCKFMAGKWNYVD